MPASPMRFSPRREPRADNHKRGRSLENGVVFKDRDDDLALFNEVQSRERDNFLLLSNDDFEDTFGTKLRDFSDHKLGINIAPRGESSDFLNTEEEKNDYEWLITPPDTPLFPSLDDEAPQIIVPHRGRPISISRSSTMEKSHRSSRGSPSPNRLSPSPRKTAFQTPTTTGSRRPSSPSSKPSTTPPRASTPTSRRLSTGSTTTRGTSGISPVKTSRGNSASPKIKAWQANIPGFSAEAPPNLRTSLVDRPASYVRGSSPASRSSRQSMSPTPSRSISSSHSHDRDRFSPRSKGSSVDDDDVESLPCVIVDDSQRLNLRKLRNNNNKASFSQKRTVSSNSAPKRSFDLALRQMDQKRIAAQNRFRPLLTSAPSSTLYAGKPSPAWNSSVTTTSSNASSDPPTTYAHEIEENEDEATSGCVKEPDSTSVDDQVLIFEKTNEDETHEIPSSLEFGDSKDGFENLADCDTAAETTCIVSDDFKEVEDETTSLCSKCGCRYSDLTPIQDEIKLCENCQNLYSSFTANDTLAQVAMSDEDHDESSNTMNPPVEVESLPIPLEQHEDLVKDGHEEPIAETQLEEEVSYQVISQASYSDAGSDQIQHDSKVEPLVFKKSNSIKELVARSGNFSASSISYDDLSYVRESTNSMRSSFGGRGSLSASSSFDFGPSSVHTNTETRFQRQSSNKKSEHHRRSLSSFSNTSNHALNPPSVGTSTLDSFEVSSVHRGGKDVAADVASPCEHENENENDTWTETENEDVENVGGETEVPMVNQTGYESTNLEDLCEDDDDDDDDNEEDTHSNVCAEQVEAELSVISEGENDQNCSPDSHSDVPQELHVGDTTHDTSTINEESLVLIEGEGKTKGRSLTLEEATDTILFCSSIVHNLAYEAATLSIQKQTATNPDSSEKLIPTVGKGTKEVEVVQTKQKTRKKKKATTKPTSNNNINTDTNEETDLGKPRIVYPNNKENRRPPKLESKCNCSIM